MGLINSNKNLKDFQPTKVASASELEKVSTDKVTFDTNLKITNHSRNKLAALATLGYTESQKNAIDLLFQSFMDQLDSDSKKELELQIKTFEKRDIKLKG